MSLCMGCMREKGETQVCPYCGLDEVDIRKSNPAFLPPGFTLNNRYIVGVALGQGGFGITYIGYDKVLNMPVAIKEYYPTDIASRTSSDGTVAPFTKSIENYTHGKEKFIDEARTLAKFADHPCIVGVKDCFNANDTAYMIMEYLNGTNLKDYLKNNGGKLSINEAISMLSPVMEALDTIHSNGIIHRDISPDNIFITNNGRIRLIDFGAARQSVNGQKSLSIMLKPGYAPEEQYRTKGNQGPWTDVYALAATFYKMITGNVPPDSLDRVMEDTLEIPKDIPVYVQVALRTGLAVRATERFSSVSQLKSALIGKNISLNNDDNTTKDVFEPTDDNLYTRTNRSYTGENVSYTQRNTEKRMVKPKNTSKLLVSSIIIMALILIVTIIMIGTVLYSQLRENGGSSLASDSQVNKRYEVCVDMVTWETAKQRAENMGGHLITINNEDEFNKIINILSDKQYNKVRNVWIGAKATKSLSNYSEASSYWNSSNAKWITGEAFTFAQWRHNEPSGCDPNLKTPEPYLQIFRPKEDGYEWSFNDSGDDLSHYKQGTVAYIVELD